MFKITEEAIREMKNALLNAGLPNYGVRIFSSSCCGSIGFGATEKGKEDDIIIEREGLKIFIDPILYLQLSQSTLDYEDGFVIKGSD